MDRTKINPSQPDSLKKGVPIGLSLKITGIVFWGLVLIGLILVVGAIEWLERDLVRHHDGIENDTFTLTREILEQAPDASDTNLRHALNKVLESTGATGLVLTSRNRKPLTVGQTEGELDKRNVFFSIAPPR